MVSDDNRNIAAVTRSANSNKCLHFEMINELLDKYLDHSEQPVNNLLCRTVLPGFYKQSKNQDPELLWALYSAKKEVSFYAVHLNES